MGSTRWADESDDDDEIRGESDNSVELTNSHANDSKKSISRQSKPNGDSGEKSENVKDSFSKINDLKLSEVKLSNRRNKDKNIINNVTETGAGSEPVALGKGIVPAAGGSDKIRDNRDPKLMTKKNKDSEGLIKVAHDTPNSNAGDRRFNTSIKSSTDRRNHLDTPNYRYGEIAVRGFVDTIPMDAEKLVRSVLYPSFNPSKVKSIESKGKIVVFVKFDTQSEAEKAILVFTADDAKTKLSAELTLPQFERSYFNDPSKRTNYRRNKGLYSATSTRGDSPDFSNLHRLDDAKSVNRNPNTTRLE